MRWTLACRTLSLELDELGRLVSLRHRAADYELLQAAGHPVPLWQLGLIRPVGYSSAPSLRVPDILYKGHEWWANRLEYDADLDLAAGGTPAVVQTPGRLALTWRLPADGGEATVTVTVRGGSDDEEFAFGAEVAVPAGWAIKRLTCPCLRGLGDAQAAAEDALLYPENWGVLRRNPLADMTSYTGQYPGAVNWCQMAAWLHGEAGLYLSVRDPDTHHTGIDVQYVEGADAAPWNTERWHMPKAGRLPPPVYTALPLAERLTAGRQPAMNLRVNHWPEQCALWRVPYPVILRGFTGGWYEAACLHGAWARQQRWCRRGPLAERRDHSSALAGLDLWFSRYAFHPGALEPAPAWEFRDAILRLHEFFGMPFGVHWYNWHNFSWHRNFPGHSPPQEGFEAVKNELQARGIVIMPYCQGRLLYRDRATFEQERTHASLEANGQPYLELYTPQDDWPLALCPGDSWAQAQWQAAARMLWERYGVEGVYFDQVCAMPPSLCYHSGHGHPLGGGTFYWRGYDQFLGGLAELRNRDPRRFLSSELMADAFLDRIDLYLAFVPPLEDYVPLHPAIYGGYTTVMGRATPSAVLADLQLFVMAQGEQLLFGGQLGWINDEILQRPAAAVCLRDLARLRRQVRDCLHYGRLAAPLACEVSGAPLVLALPEALCGKPRPVLLERPAIRHTVWHGPHDKRLIMLLNEARDERCIRLQLPAELAARRWQLFSQGRAEDAVPLPLSQGAVELAVPPLTAVALCAMPPT